MLITNAKVFIDGEFRNVEVKYSNGVITEIGTKLCDEERIDAEGQYLYAGMIDTHIHGGFTYSFSDNGYVDYNNGEEQVREICRRLPYYGVTSCIPTIDGGASLDALVRSTRTIRAARANIIGADPFKIHYEGPYMNPLQTAAINPSFQVNPDKEHTLKMTDGDLSDVALICLAPELPGAMEWLDWVTAKGVKAEICYTQADSCLVRKAADHGLDQASHLFNGFQLMHHRINGPVLGCILESRINAQILCDDVHVASDWIKLALRVKGLEHIYGISDMTNFSGLPEGDYEFPFLGAASVKGKRIISKDGRVLGGNTTWNEMMYSARNNIGLSMEEVGSIYSENPAKCLGILDRGKIERGRRADFVLMDKEYHVLQTIILGKTYCRQPYNNANSIDICH